MAPTFFFFFSFIIIAINLSSFVNSVNINEKSENVSERGDKNSCFATSSFFIARTLKVAIITVDLLAPRGVTKSSVSNKVKLMLANKQFIDKLRSEMYNVFVTSGGSPDKDHERFKIAFGIPTTDQEKKKLNQLAKKSKTELASESMPFQNCKIGDLPSHRVDELGYTISAKRWYDGDKDVLLFETREDKFRRHGEYCNGKVTALQYLCEKQLADKHILNSIMEHIGEKKKISIVKILAIGDHLSYIGHAFENDKKNPPKGFREDITLIKFPGTSPKTAINKYVKSLTSQIQGVTNVFSKAMSDLPQDKNYNVCQVSSSGKLRKKYSLSC